MKTKNLRTWMTTAFSTFITAALLISPVVFAAEKGENREKRERSEKEDLKSKVIINVEGLTCPFCAYGLEKRIKKLPDVQKSTINIKEGIIELFPKEGQHIDIDEVTAAIKSGGFTPKDSYVALAGKLTEWNGETVLSIVSTSKENQKEETKYLLKENEKLKKLKALVKSSEKDVFISGKAIKSTPDGHADHPYTIVIETFHLFSKEDE